VLRQTAFEPEPPALPAPATTISAFGYICVQHENEDEITALHDQVANYTSANHLNLVEVYVDRNVWPGQVIRPGLTVLLDAVVRSEGCVVVVPSAAHLSPEGAIRRAVEVEIQMLGARTVTCVR